MSLVAELIRRLFGRPGTELRSTPPLDPERLQRIYREIHRQVEDLRRAA